MRSLLSTAQSRNTHFENHEVTINSGLMSKTLQPNFWDSTLSEAQKTPVPNDTEPTHYTPIAPTGKGFRALMIQNSGLFPK